MSTQFLHFAFGIDAHARAQGLVTASIECSHLRPESSKSDGDAVRMRDDDFSASFCSCWPGFERHCMGCRWSPLVVDGKALASNLPDRAAVDLTFRFNIPVRSRERVNMIVYCWMHQLIFLERTFQTLHVEVPQHG